MEQTMEQTMVVIVGAGPSGLATSAGLSINAIPHILLEKDDCYASLWKKRSYDRLNLHLAKEFCNLPYKPFPKNSPTYLSKRQFIEYLDDYVSHFDIKPQYHRSVESATYDIRENRWAIRAKNTRSGNVEVYASNFLIVASGENSEGYIPSLPGLDSFERDIIHARDYKNGENYEGKEVLVVGCGNSGMEIALDLSNFGAHTSIVIRSPVHVMSRETIRVGMKLLEKNVPTFFVDFVVTLMANVVFGDLTKYGIKRPKEGPFHIKKTTGRSATIDVGTIKMIKKKKIKVLPGISKVEKKLVVFENGLKKEFDAIVFATGYKSTSSTWLKDFEYLLNDNGWPKSKLPAHWKGENNLYCAGLSRSGLLGVSMDAKAIVADINKAINKPHGVSMDAKPAVADLNTALIKSKSQK